ncbi:HD-GYP domain-containing protein [Vibrio sp. 99-70-13A1]|uniref:HD-GYP domain-containing protein n=1 Tax=Vibrio sp. 99-70-13A1 TaxID=2607601 RepID=UPI00149357FF|nr:HD-GYP domain-containing protein [Vibrio sp. 99-70-13A1]NOH97627.1 HD-GYP domain-containing protein [Vibrio sp. 99-70-13A1]
MHKHSPESSIKVQISEISIGMFVTGIENNTRINLTNAGRVSSQTGIDSLLKNNIKFVWVDEGLSDSKIDFSTLTVFNPADEAQPSEPATTTTQSLRSKRKSNVKGTAAARSLVEEAKGIASKVINKAFDGQAFSVDEFDAWADDLISFTLTDKDAIRLVSALRSKDEYLLEHSVSVSTLLVTFARYLGYSEAELKQFAIGGIIHDIGKVKVDDKVLHKPAKLTAEEFEHMKMHQTYALDLIKNIKGLSVISRDVCLMHHEKLDGNGYPKGLTGDQLPVHGRMSSIVDIFDALTADRVYKKSMSPQEAFKILLGMTPNHLDSNLVYQFINCLGVYPVASLVELSNGRAAIVWESNQKHSKKPIVKSFYSIKHKHFTEIEFKDLAKSDLTIVRAISPSEFDFDINNFIH